MRAILSNFGSIGDIMSLCTLALELEQRGHEAIMAVSPHLVPVVTQFGCKYAVTGPDVGQAHYDMLRQDVEGRFNFEDGQAFKPFLEALKPAYYDLAAACKDADVLICGASFPLGLMVHELTGIPYVSVQFDYPNERENFLRHPSTRNFIDPFRATFGLPPVRLDQPLAHVGVSPQLAIIAISRHLLPPQPNWPAHYHAVGWFFMKREWWQPDPELLAFLEDGEPPIFISFGSMLHDDPATLTRIVLEAAQKVGRRTILQMGWAGLAQQLEDNPPANMHIVKFLSHAWIFPRVACVVHHAGTGTLAAILRAGVPSVCVPHIFDQHDCSVFARAFGCAGPVVPYHQLTAERLSKAIVHTLSNSCYREAAAHVRDYILAEEGLNGAYRLIEELLHR